jgi:intracellular sulfur oxidation DsrE/DsrF family protein
MYDVNDALASILAICDMEQVSSLPQVKKYINRVNDLLSDVKHYQDRRVFNINHVLKNVVNIMEDSFKHRIKLTLRTPAANLLVESEKAQIEQILLYSLIEFATRADDKCPEVIVELNQKDTTAQITVSAVDFSFSPHAMEELSAMRNNFDGRLRMKTDDRKVEIEMGLPIRFRQPEKGRSPQLGQISVVSVNRVIGHSLPFPNLIAFDEWLV